MIGSIKKYGQILDLSSMTISIDRSTSKCYSNAELSTKLSKPALDEISSMATKINQSTDMRLNSIHKNIVKKLSTKLKRYDMSK